MKPKAWIAGWLALVLVIAVPLGCLVYRVDPFMHYRKPDTEHYFYLLDNERSQNDGIAKHFEYDALITGTSMTENFKTSEMDRIFGCISVKVPFAGGHYKEIDEIIRVGLRHNPALKTVVRGLDEGYFTLRKDSERSDLGEYPTYLYDENPLNDVKYLLNREVIWNRAFPMMTGTERGITPFDDYAAWQDEQVFGIRAVPDGMAEYQVGEPIHLTPEEKERVKGNIEQNVVALAKEYPEVDFYYFFTPYSAVWWRGLVDNGGIYRQLEAEQYAIELILEAENIKLFSFNNRYDITTDLNNYFDVHHYGTWVNSLMLKWMHEGTYRLTKENYRDYLAKEAAFYTTFDYESLNRQEDYENDLYAAALYNEELTGVSPTEIAMEPANFTLKNATIAENLYDGKAGLVCTGSLPQSEGENLSAEELLRTGRFVGGSTIVEMAEGNHYLAFYGKKGEQYGHPIVMIFDEAGQMRAKFSAEAADLDEAWHLYLMDVSDLSGTMKVVFSGGSRADAGAEDATFIFSGACLY